MSDQDKSSVQELAVRWTQAQPTVAAFISATIPSFHDSEDVLQRVAATLVTKYAKYDPERPFVAWALGIARIEVLRYRSEVGKDRMIFDEEVVRQIARAYEQIIPHVDEMREVLNRCVKQLRGRVKQVLEMRYLRELAPARIAQQLGMTSNAVFVALHRSRVALRKCMQQGLGQQEGNG